MHWLAAWKLQAASCTNEECISLCREFAKIPLSKKDYPKKGSMNHALLGFLLTTLMRFARIYWKETHIRWKAYGSLTKIPFLKAFWLKNGKRRFNECLLLLVFHLFLMKHQSLLIGSFPIIPILNDSN